jgi:hypothetical protein
MRLFDPALMILCSGLLTSSARLRRFSPTSGSPCWRIPVGCWHARNRRSIHRRRMRSYFGARWRLPGFTVSSASAASVRAHVVRASASPPPILVLWLCQRLVDLILARIRLSSFAWSPAAVPPYCFAAFV